MDEFLNVIFLKFVRNELFVDKSLRPRTKGKENFKFKFEERTVKY